MQTTQQVVNIYFADRIRESGKILCSETLILVYVTSFFSFVSHKISTQIHNAAKKNIIRFEIRVNIYNTFVTITDIYCLIMTQLLIKIFPD